MSDEANDYLQMTEGSVTGSTYTPLSDEEVTKLAKAMYRNEVFFSFMIPENQRIRMIPMVFMVVLFMDDITKKQLVANEIDVFYEYMSEAGPRGINGYPTFFSCRSMTRNDGNRVINKYNEIRRLLGDD
jgi:hypothetical protein